MARRATDVDDYVGRRIRQGRFEQGQSQSDLANALGISFQQIQKYENGTNRVSAGRLYAVAQHLGVTLDYFFEGMELPTANQPTPELRFKNDTQAITIIRRFAQISNAGTRSAVVALLSSIAMAETPQAKPRKRPGAKRKS